MIKVTGKPLWITWERAQRSRSLSRELDAQLVEMVFSGKRWLRYSALASRTLAVLMRSRTKRIYVQNPSIVLAALVVLFGMVSRREVVVDAHNAGIWPMEGRSRYALALAGWINRHARLTIVTNRGMAEEVERRGGAAFILPDPVPRLEEGRRPSWPGDRFSVLFICTWAQDEPYLDVLKAAERLPEGFRIYITGNSRGRERRFPGKLPDNVTLTGFLSETDFVGLLRAVDVVMDLTLRDHCLVCGAYEAVAAQKPMILSDSVALREYFSSGAVYTKNDPDHIAQSILSAARDIDQLRRDVVRLGNQLSESWQSQRDGLLALLSAGSPGLALEIRE